MAGHSKWANIKHRKGAQDAKRSKEFQKISKEIMVSIKTAGNDPITNTRLRMAIDKAKSFNMPNDNIKRLLDKGSKDTSTYTEIVYEGYGPGGVAILIECLTDNLNRTSPQVRSTLAKNGGNLGTAGSVSYMFDTKGQLVLDKEKYEFDSLMELIINLDILDLKEEDNFIIIETTPANFIATKEFLIENKISDFISAEINKVPNIIVSIDERTMEKIIKIIDELEDLDDIQNVYTNMG